MSTTAQVWHKVHLVNVNSVDTRCGYGEGRTLGEAQENALRKARMTDPNARLGGCGYVVLFAERVCL